MKSIILAALGLALGGIASGGARADTIFDVEHARADARAGRVSEYDEEYLERWGRLSGSYPSSRVDYRARHRIRLDRHDRRMRHW